MITGKMKERLDPTGTWLWVDVRVCSPTPPYFTLRANHLNRMLPLLMLMQSKSLKQVEKDFLLLPASSAINNWPILLLEASPSLLTDSQLQENPTTDTQTEGSIMVTILVLKRSLD